MAFVWVFLLVASVGAAALSGRVGALTPAIAEAIGLDAGGERRVVELLETVRGMQRVHGEQPLRWAIEAGRMIRGGAAVEAGRDRPRPHPHGPS